MKVQFDFSALYNTKLQCLKLEDHVPLDFNNSMFATAVLLDMEKALDTS
jgi:hypothetical protein